MTGRGRLTITSLVYVVLAMASLVALYPAYRMVLSEAAPGLDAGTVLVFQTVLPVAVLVLLAVIYVEARSGGA